MIKIDIRITIQETENQQEEKFIDKLTKRIKRYLKENPIETENNI